MLQALVFKFQRRKIARKNIKALADEFGLSVSIHTVGDKNVVRYGNGEVKVELGLFKDHYFIHKKTKFNSYALVNYHNIKDKKRWWTFKSETRRDDSRGVMTTELLKLLVDDGRHLQKIDISSAGVFRTQFHDKVTQGFNTLEYPEKHVRPFHEERFKFDRTTREIMRDPEIDKAFKCVEKAINRQSGSLLSKLYEKSNRLGLGDAEELKLFRRSVPDDARVFYDFEASPFDQHTPYMVAFQGDEDGEPQVIIGQDCAKQFLDVIAERYGKLFRAGYDQKTFIAPKIRLIAHNQSYDMAFLWEHLHRTKMVERGTKVVTGSARYYYKLRRGLVAPLLRAPRAFCGMHA